MHFHPGSSRSLGGQVQGWACEEEVSLHRGCKRKLTCKATDMVILRLCDGGDC